ncbi:MAG: radical SAM protein [Pseudomonadota bacterium]
MSNFIKFFQTKEKYYFYEAYNDELYEIPEIFYNVFPHLLKKKNLKEIKNQLKSVYSKNDISKVLACELAKDEYQYLLSALPPVKYKNPLDEKKTYEEYKTKIDQIVLNLTDNCNFRCNYCFLSHLERKSKDNYAPKTMTFIIAQKAIEFLNEFSSDSETVSISFYGGEPLLKFKLIEKIVNYARKSLIDKQIQFFMTTNATLITEDKLSFLKKNKFSILISLDGPDKIHNRHRHNSRGRGTFSSTLKGINLIRNKFPKYFKDYVKFNTVITPPYAFDDINRFFFKELKIPITKISYSFVDDHEIDFFKKFPITKDDLQQYYKLYKKYIEERLSSNKRPSHISSEIFSNRFENVGKSVCENIYESDLYPTAQCVPGLTKLFISPDGKFQMCERVDLKESMGDVFGGFDFETLKKVMNEYYADAKKTCSRCWAMRLCRLCMQDVIENGKFNKTKKRNVCKNHRETLLNSLKDYCLIIEKNPNAFDYLKDSD